MDIPEPPNRGSSGKQQSEESDAAQIQPYAPLAGLPLAERVEGIAATRPRNLGGEVAATLIAGTFTQMSDDLRSHRQQAAISLERNSGLQERLGESQTRIAVLEERLAAYERTQTVKQVSIFAGTALLAVAIDLLKADLKAIAAVLSLLGIGLLGFGWLTRAGGSRK